MPDNTLHIDIVFFTTLSSILRWVIPKEKCQLVSQRIYYSMDNYIQLVANQLSTHHQRHHHSASPLGGLRILQVQGELWQSQNSINGSCLHKLEGREALPPQEALTDEILYKSIQQNCGVHTWISHQASAVHGSSITRSKVVPLCWYFFCTSHWK